MDLPGACLIPYCCPTCGVAGYFPPGWHDPLGRSIAICSSHQVPLVRARACTADQVAELLVRGLAVYHQRDPGVVPGLITAVAGQALIVPDDDTEDTAVLGFHRDGRPYVHRVLVTYP